MQDRMPPEAAREIEYVKSLVARHFPVYDVKVNLDVIEFYCRVDETTLEESFERLREDMGPKGYIPMITYSKGEHVVVVGKKPKAKYRSVKVNFAMLLITFLTVSIAGALTWAGYADVPQSDMFSLRTISMGILFFTLPLMGILGIHELGHYFMARKRKVAASLPFFIPSIPPLGTIGAVISLRDPIPNKKNLLEIGIAGPLAGLLVTIPIAIAGLLLTNMDARVVPTDFGTGEIVRWESPLIYAWLQELFPSEGAYLMHPMAFAGWLGFFLTALNLLPAGQLDGGHIARALLGDKARYASWVTIAALIVLSLYWFPWLILVVVVLLFGARHPPPLNDITKLDGKRKAAGVMAFLLLAVIFVPVPLSVVAADHSFEMVPSGDRNVTVGIGEAAVFFFVIESSGNVDSNVTIEPSEITQGLDVSLRRTDASSDYASTVSFALDVSENASFEVRIIPTGSTVPGNATAVVTAYAHSDPDETYFEESLRYNITVTLPALEFWLPEGSMTVAAGSDATATMQVNNTGGGDVDITITAVHVPSLMGVTLYSDSLDANSTGTLNVTVPASGSTSFEILVFVSSSAPTGDFSVDLVAMYYDAELDTVGVPVTVT